MHITTMAEEVKVTEFKMPEPQADATAASMI